jgi:CCR4-NOT transcription complex subunit 3
MSNVVKAPVPKPPQLPPIKYATVAQAMTQSSQQSHTSTAASSTTHLPATSQPQTSPSATTTSPLVPPPSSMQDQSSISASSPSLTHPSVASPILSSAASVSHQPDGSTYSAQDSPVSSDAVPAKAQLPTSPQKSAPAPKCKLTRFSFCVFNLTKKNVAASTDQLQQVSNDSQAAVSQAVPGPSPLPQQVQQVPSAIRAKSPPSATQSQPIFPPGVKVAQGEQQQQPAIGYQRPLSSAAPPSQQPRASASSAFPGSLQDLVVSFENVKQKGGQQMIKQLARH